MTKVAAWAGRASNGRAPLPTARSACTTALLPLALTACSDLREVPARDVLRDAGYERIVSTPESWLFGPCQWTEPYAARFVASKGEERWTGMICATGENAEDARIIAVRVVPQPETWDRFARGRR